LKIELTQQQYRYLLDLVYIGNWVLNSTRGDDRIKEYDQVESLVFSHCLQHKMSKLVELYKGELIPSRAFADGGIHEAIEEYEDVAFYEILAEEMAMRDMDGQPMTHENYDELMERINRYLEEFDAHGTDHISVDLGGE
jgi:5'(3')-deoxyribonucleotidase